MGQAVPARIADACLGALTAVLADRAGVLCRHAARYADRHGERAAAPVIAISLRGLGRGLRPRQIVTVIGQMRAFGEYVRSGEDADDLAVRTARIRAKMEGPLTILGLDIPVDALEPYHDFVAAKIASEATAATAA